MTIPRERFIERIEALKADDAEFESLALEVFRYQYKNNEIYRTYCTLIKKNPTTVKELQEIPFLPISFFKNFTVKTGQWSEETVFTSSGTTGAITSSHYVRDISFYNKIACAGFENFYGAIKNYCVLGLLPAYLERTGSSLVAMSDDFIRRSCYTQSGFFLYDHEKLYGILKNNNEKKIPTLLIGVTFALLDFTDQFSIDFPELIIMETGGMKGRRKEMIREELHGILKKNFGVPHIHSEYGMTELLSQGYSTGSGIFVPISSMRVFVREVTDPFSVFSTSSSRSNGDRTLITAKTGVINIIDLANIDTCAFVATDDLGKLYADGTFEVSGRLDNADIRGCNLLVL